MVVVASSAVTIREMLDEWGESQRSVGDGGTGYKRLRRTAAEVAQRVGCRRSILPLTNAGVTAGLGCPRGDWVGLKRKC